MKVMYLGEVVRQRRKTLGVSMEQVCEGLCTAMTLSRFENGRQTPSWDSVAAILQRLGLPDGRYYAQLTRVETKLILLRKKTLAYCKQFEQTQGEVQQQARMKALELLCELERCIKEDDHINQQFILRLRVLLETHSSSEQLAMLMEAIRLTSPRFDLENLSSCLYCSEEVMTISQIAIYYVCHGQRRKAIDIYGQLLKLLQKRMPEHEQLHLIAYNYALYLAAEKRLEEALEISAIGRQNCIRQGYYSMLPKFLHIEAECHYLMGKIGKSLELYKSAYHIYGATIDTKNQSTLKADMERFNLSFNLQDSLSPDPAVHLSSE